MSMLGSKKKLAMTDLDGTLVNTLAVNYESYRQALEEAGYPLSLETYERDCFGRTYRDFLPELMPGADSDAMQRVHDRKIQLYAGLLDRLQLNEHLCAMLDGLRETYILALVTTASAVNTRRVLRHFHLEDFFDAVFTQEDMKCPKPAPDCYLDVMAQFGIGPQDAVIFEDSPSGLASAKGSGCTVFSMAGWGEKA